MHRVPTVVMSSQAVFGWEDCDWFGFQNLHLPTEGGGASKRIPAGGSGEDYGHRQYSPYPRDYIILWYGSMAFMSVLMSERMPRLQPDF